VKRLVLALGLLFSASAARAEDVRLSWVRAEGAESCVDETALRREIVARLASDPFVEGATRSFEGVVVRAETGWRASYVVRDGATVVGAREIEGEGECASLTDALALSIALAIDPNASVERRASEAEVPAVVAPVVSEPAPAASVTPVEAPQDVVNFLDEVSAGAAGAWQLLPGLSAGLSLGVGGYVVGGLRWQAGFRWHPQRTADDDRFDFGLAAANVGVCYEVFASSRFEVAPCLDVLAGAVHSVVAELSPVEPGEELFVAGRAGLRASVRLLGPLRVGLRASAIVPFTAYDFVVTGIDNPVFSMDSVVVDGEVFVAVRFP
jgi:hypothetical protein